MIGGCACIFVVGSIDIAGKLRAAVSKPIPACRFDMGHGSRFSALIRSEVTWFSRMYVDHASEFTWIT